VAAVSGPCEVHGSENVNVREEHLVQ